MLLLLLLLLAVGCSALYLSQSKRLKDDQFCCAGWFVV
jgi:hypothetical protein